MFNYNRASHGAENVTCQAATALDTAGNYNRASHGAEHVTCHAATALDTPLNPVALDPTPSGKIVAYW